MPEAGAGLRAVGVGRRAVLIWRRPRSDSGCSLMYDMNLSCCYRATFTPVTSFPTLQPIAAWRAAIPRRRPSRRAPCSRGAYAWHLHAAASRAASHFHQCPCCTRTALAMILCLSGYCSCLQHAGSLQRCYAIFVTTWVRCTDCTAICACTACAVPCTASGTRWRTAQASTAG